MDLLEPSSATWGEHIVRLLPMTSRTAGNPHQDTAERQAVQWASQRGLIKDEGVMRQLIALRPGRLNGYGFPNAGEGTLILLTKWLIYFFLTDDQFDDGDAGTDPGHAEKLLSPLRACLDHPKTCTARAPRVNALSDLLTSTRPRFTDPQWRQFTRHLRDYFDALVQEARNRRTSTTPTVEEYLRLRQNTGPILPLFDFVEECECIRLPVSFYDTEEYRTILVGSSDVSHWLNDVFSAPKEHARGDVHNLVLIIRHVERCTFEEAVAKSTDHMRRRLAEMHTAVEKVHAMHADGLFTNGERDAITAWYQALLTCTRHAAWYLESGRYTEASA
ncbi:terpene synthase family protein [Streptomyces sp. NPDC102490]|uniref:terpene synthase family protein n=1 Tax=Streptomyces sp. NPDC102490 TaxID=3366183 RepID=UPI00381D6025